MGSAITNGREPRSCLGRVFNSKLGCIATPGSKCMECMQPLLKLKTRPKAHPASLSLSMVDTFFRRDSCQFILSVGRESLERFYSDCPVVMGGMSNGVL
jgi:hypothetical protein